MRGDQDARQGCGRQYAMRIPDGSIPRRGNNTNPAHTRLLLAGGILFLSVLGFGISRSWEINVSYPARAGGVPLPAGHYTLTLDDSRAVFTKTGSGSTYSLPVKLGKSAQKYGRTAVNSRVEGNTEVIDAIELAGTNTRIEFLFAQPLPTETAPPEAALTSIPLVRLNVVASDAGGRPVLDLSAADFRILDNGKPQTIASFRHREALPESSPLGP